MKRTEMKIQILAVLSHIWASVGATLSTAWGKLLMGAAFLGSLISPLNGILAITLILVLIDAALGISVSTKNKGKICILSSRLRDTLLKASVYCGTIILFYLVERQIIDDWNLGAKVIFGITSAVELISIGANALILWPDLPILKLFSRMLESEVARKSGLDMADVRKMLNKDEGKSDSASGADNTAE